MTKQTDTQDAAQTAAAVLDDAALSDVQGGAVAALPAVQSGLLPAVQSTLLPAVQSSLLPAVQK